MSRRLGRPAKKRENAQDDHLDNGGSDHTRHQANRRIRSPRKRKVKQERGRGSGNDAINSQDEEELILEEMTFNDSLVDNIPAEDTRLPTPPFLDTEKPSLYDGCDTIDLSDNWLQEFISSQPADLTQDRNFLDALGLNSNAENSLTAIPTSLKDLASSITGVQASSELQDQLPLAYYPTGNSFAPYDEPLSEAAHLTADMAAPYGEILRRDSLTWSQHVPSTRNDPARLPVASEHTNPLVTNKTQRRNHEYGPSPEDTRLTTQLATRQYHFQCHEHAARELMLVGVTASGTWPAVTIDSILNYQRTLHQLADTILRCAICCKTRLNLLMVVVVSIDSLITTIETITSVDNGVMDGLFAEYHDHRFREYGQATGHGTTNRRYRNASFCFKAKVEECPLLVGGFPVPSEEKFTFVKQVLHTRLCGLSNIIARIQFCTQRILAIPASSGKVSMMTETEQRLQLILTKMKPPARR
ncbi:uncharacterized protein BDW43DRAFT_312634 [Aspergillus alliaceus]|uniref:uncharacterized protein n=1 Tax=Petromyces alliaceus TaxID=209559 RepID=UPI0012A6EABB|nr:uncharacterized protein BDW43DRAFT_312634 [Aspergillus alliaceus]KAB8232020.1 hypothetical protein BDW43DRAFT_312634 [Aspergillus alliaceus]